jgi:hypothetical protein
MFDALDECYDRHQGEVIWIIQQFNEAGIRVYVTARDPHWVSNQLKARPFEIKAQYDDVKNYVTQQMRKRKLPTLDCELKTEIIENISSGVHGM